MRIPASPQRIRTSRLARHIRQLDAGCERTTVDKKAEKRKTIYRASFMARVVGKTVYFDRIEGDTASTTSCVIFSKAGLARHIKALQSVLKELQ